jgi:hypothetical protein
MSDLPDNVSDLMRLVETGIEERKKLTQRITTAFERIGRSDEHFSKLDERLKLIELIQAPKTAEDFIASVDRVAKQFEVSMKSFKEAISAYDLLTARVERLEGSDTSLDEDGENDMDGIDRLPWKNFKEHRPVKWPVWILSNNGKSLHLWHKSPKINKNTGMWIYPNELGS